jgi:dolichol-phosphate mannosyltransferase
MDLSVVIPVKDEADNVAALVEEIRAVLDELVNYEIIYVDDGSDDATVAEVLRLRGGMPQVRLMRHAKTCGQSAAIRTGAPVDQPLLITGHRENRQDKWSKRWASCIANAIRRRFLRDDTPDTGCGLKLFPRSVFLDLPFFNNMHRFLPALVLREGGVVRSLPVNDRPRLTGRSKYGVIDRLLVGIVDLFGVMWLQRRAARPHLLSEAVPHADATPSRELPASAASVPS